MFGNDDRPRYGQRGRKGTGTPKTDEERLKEHFGSDWRNHTVDELPPRQHKNRNPSGQGRRRV